MARACPAPHHHYGHHRRQQQQPLTSTVATMHRRARLGFGPTGKVWRRSWLIITWRGLGMVTVSGRVDGSAWVCSMNIRQDHQPVLYPTSPTSDCLPSRLDLPPLSGRQLPCLAEPWASAGLSTSRPHCSPVVGPAAAVLSGHFGLSSADFAVTLRLSAPATSPLACPNPPLIGLSVPPQTPCLNPPSRSAPRPASPRIVSHRLASPPIAATTYLPAWARAGPPRTLHATLSKPLQTPGI